MATLNIGTDTGRGIWQDKGGQRFNLLAYGAAADAKVATGGAITASDNTLTVSAGDTFVAGDVGKAIRVPGAGASGATLTTTIASYTSATEVELTAAASTTVSAKTITWGTNNASALSTALSAITTAGGGTLYVPYSGTGIYYIGSQISVADGVSIECAPNVWFDCGGGQHDGFRFDDWQDAYARNLRVRHIVAGSGTEYQGILLVGACQRFLLDHCRGENCADVGITVKRNSSSGDKPTDGILLGCIGSNSTAGSGIEVYRADRITLINCRAFGNSEHGIRMVGGAGNRLDSCRAGDNTDQQMYLGGAGDGGANITETLRDFDVLTPHVYATASGPTTGISLRDGCRRGRIIGGQIDAGGYISNAIYARNEASITGTDHGARDIQITGLTIRGALYGVRVFGAHRNITAANLDIYSGLHSSGDNLALLLADQSLIAKHILMDNVRQHYSEGTVANVKQYAVTDGNAGTSVYFRNFKRIVDVSGGTWGSNSRTTSAGTLSETGLETIAF